MKNRERRYRKLLKQEKAVLTRVARTIGSTIGTVVAGTERLRQKSLAIGAQAGAVARKARKQLSTATRRVRATTRHTHRPKRKS